MSQIGIMSAERAHILTHSCVIVKMDFDVTADNASKGSDKVIHLTRVSASNGIGDTDTVDTNAVNGLVDREQVDKV